MHGHLIIALCTLALAAWIDLQTRRIPNHLLLLGCLVHLTFWMATGHGIPVTAPLLIFIGSLILGLTMKRVSLILISSIGMGDIKLITYLLAFIVPFLDLLQWLLALALVSIMSLVLIITISDQRQGSLQRSLPFAPLLFLGTVLALGL